MRRRRLTPAEIEEICAVIPINRSIPIETAECVRAGLQANLREQLVDVEIVDQGVPELKRVVEEEYYRSLLQPGEMIGVQAATSIGEPVSQMTLNAFHYSGISTIGISSGVPRVEEILNASKKQKSRVMNLFMKDRTLDIGAIRAEAYHSVCEVYLNTLMRSVSISYVRRFEELDEFDQQWYALYLGMYVNEILVDNEFAASWRVRCELDRDKLFHHSITTLDVARKIEESFRDLHAVASPNNIGIVDVFIDFNSIKIKKKEEEMIADLEDSKEIRCIRNVVLPYLGDIQISGIEGVTDVYLHKEQNEWVIDTNGSNLYAAFANQALDHTRCSSSDIWEIYRVLGVEATRNFIIQEFYKVLATSGASVGRRHVELLADSMTYQGKINSVNRYGIDRDQIGPMAKASFEESVRNFFIAAVNGETDHMGVSSSIMGGKLVKSGTGFVDLVLDQDMLRGAPSLPAFEYPAHVRAAEAARVESDRVRRDVRDQRDVRDHRDERARLVERVSDTRRLLEAAPVSAPVSAPVTEMFALPTLTLQQPTYDVRPTELPGFKGAVVERPRASRQTEREPDRAKPRARPKEPPVPETPIKFSFMKKKVPIKNEVLLEFEDE